MLAVNDMAFFIGLAIWMVGMNHQMRAKITTHYNPSYIATLVGVAIMAACIYNVYNAT